MQAIAGTYGRPDKSLVRKMLARIRHRGPDRMGFFEDDQIALGAGVADSRIGAKTKAIAVDDGVAVVSDSYLFNRGFIQQTLFGRIDRRMSDAEFVLRAYRILGTQLFESIDGAFVIVIVDNGDLVLARDRYGLKPLYLSGGTRDGAFSSEMKSQILVEDEFVPFPPGSFFVKDKGFFPIQADRSWRTQSQAGADDVSLLRNLVFRTVKECIDQSQGVSVLLSGGIDSSAIAAAASEAVSEVRTACVGMEGSFDLEMARIVSSHLGTDHLERTYEADEMLNILDEVIYAAESFDFPLIRSCIPNYMAARLLGDKYRITLCGEGADEIFAGYDYMREIERDEELRAERMRLLKTCHLTGFQRVDRMTAASSLDGRMPLMSCEIIDFGLALDKSALVENRIEMSKIMFRKTFEGILPAEITWRRKKKFSDGAGSIHALREVAEEIISDKEFETERIAAPSGRIRTKEELLYFRFFKHHFDSSSALTSVGITDRP